MVPSTPPHPLQSLVQQASSWCASFGILMGGRDLESRQPLGDLILEPAPISVLPTPFPADAFASAYAMGSPFNELVHTLASSPEWLLEDAIVTAAQGDPDFTGRLVSLAQDVLEQGRTQNVVLGILRSDYMMHGPTQQPLQVELNTIASSFGCLSTKISQLHQELCPEQDNLPPNHAKDGIAKGMALAMQEYQTQFPDSQHEVALVMVVQPGETNSIDQRDLEFALKSQYDIPVLRKTLTELASCELDGTELLVPDEGNNTLYRAGVVYYRAGYTPDDYPTELEWRGRAVVEHSSAIKCPDVFYHLVGAKKVQQALAAPGVLEQFTTQAPLLRSSFAGLYPLGEGDDADVVQMALQDPHLFVLKPQREGGGNNLYNDDLVRALETMTYQERGGYIVMQKIQPPTSTGYLVRRGQIVYEGDCVCELGVFGITLRDYQTTKKVYMDEVVGHILRSKPSKTDEGGVAAGYAFLSSPKLI